MPGLLEGKVILITGAGNGIGRAHALACAREGAKVLVNDLGGAVDGSGGDLGPAARVAAEIEALGGEVLANNDSVTDPAGCERMVEAALARWGRLDALVNNAGILRDTTFRKMSEEQWQIVLEVHLNGTMRMTRAALPALMAAPQGGAIINTTSYSGLIGNFGQSNYGAAKAGIFGFSRVLSMELKKANITVNCLAPIAKTRMTENIGMVEAEWTPEQISPVVVFLASPLAREVTGRVFGVQGQRIHAYEVQMNEGVEKSGSAPWTAEEIAQHLDAIFAFGAPAAAGSPAPAPAPAGQDPVEEVFSYAPQAYLGEKAGDWRAVIHFVISGGPDHTITVGDGQAAVARGLVGAPSCTFKTDRETILGILTQKIDPQKAFMKGRITADDLGVAMKFAMFFRFEKPAEASAPPAPPAAEAAPAPEPAAWSPPIGKTYHGGYALVEPAHLEAYAAATNDPSLAYYGSDAIAPPMFHVRLLRDMMFAVVTDPELGLDVLRLVHGEYETISHRPLRPWDVVQLRARLEAVEQKAKGLVVVSRLYGLVNGEVAVEARSSYFIRGQIRLPIPASEGARTAPEQLPPPDGSLRIQVDADQSIRYAAASLDDNPIHLDAETARMAGLPDVILHGLCTMALSGRALLKAFAFEDPRQLKRLSVRFSKPVLNGSRLSLKVWKSGKELRFQVLNAEGEAVITNGLAELR